MPSELTTYTGDRLALEVENQFGDAGNVQITRDMILEWINNGVRSIVSHNPYRQEMAQTNLLAGQAVYDLSTAFPAERIQKYHSVMVDGSAVTFVPFAEFQRTVNKAGVQGEQGNPQWATDWGGKITLWPVPKATVTNGLTIYFTSFPEDMTDITQDLPVPDRFYNALLEYVLAQAAELDENPEWYALKMTRHNEELRTQFEVETSNPTDFYPAIVDDPDDNTRYWDF